MINGIIKVKKIKKKNKQKLYTSKNIEKEHVIKEEDEEINDFINKQNISTRFL